MMNVKTRPLNMVQKLINMSSAEGRNTNHMAKTLREEGYRHIYQRPYKSGVALTAKNSKGDTKTLLLWMFGYKSKTTQVSNMGNNSIIRSVDKARFNEFGNEIDGKTVLKKFVNGKNSDTVVTKRGWEG